MTKGGEIAGSTAGILKSGPENRLLRVNLCLYLILLIGDIEKRTGKPVVTGDNFKGLTGKGNKKIA